MGLCLPAPGQHLVPATQQSIDRYAHAAPWDVANVAPRCKQESGAREISTGALIHVSRNSADAASDNCATGGSPQRHDQSATRRDSGRNEYGPGSAVHPDTRPPNLTSRRDGFLPHASGLTP